MKTALIAFVCMVGMHEGLATFHQYQPGGACCYDKLMLTKVFNLSRMIQPGGLPGYKFPGNKPLTIRQILQTAPNQDTAFCTQLPGDRTYGYYSGEYTSSDSSSLMCWTCAWGGGKNCR